MVSKNSFKTNLIIGASLVLILALPVIGAAWTLEPVATSGVVFSTITGGTELINLINSAIGWVQVVLFTFAVLFLIFAAFSYLTSGGDPEKTKTAMNSVIYAIVAIAVAMISFGIKAVVQSILGAA